MKPKFTKNIHIALILSVCIHVILVFVLTRLYQREENSIDEITYLKIMEIPTERVKRPINRDQYIPPKITPTKQKQIEVDVNPPVVSLPSEQSISHQNPVVPIIEMSVPNPSEFGIGISDRTSNSPIGNQNLGNPFKLGRVESSDVLRVTKPRLYEPPIDSKLPPVSELQMPSAIMARIAYHIVEHRNTDNVDIVFVIDGSGSMKDNINAVRSHLNRMTKFFDDADLDFTLGVVIFREKMLGLDFEIFPQTRSVSHIKRRLAQVRCSGGEKALDALIRAADEVDYRENADVHFILITDEFVSGNYSASDVLRKMRQSGIRVDVVGRDEPFQKFITRSTGGLWLPITSLGVQ